MSRYEKLISSEEQLQHKIAVSEIRIQRSINSRNARKARAHRLIQKGALLEKYFDIEKLSISETEDLLKIFSTFVKEKMPDKYKKNNR